MQAYRLMTLLSAAIAALFISYPVKSQSLPNSPQHYFGDFGYCALILSRSRHEEVWIEAGPGQCQLELSPCSTFKIPNSLIGLQTGVVSGPGDLKKWDGKDRSREADRKSVV